MQTPPSFSSVAEPPPPPPQRIRFEAIGEGWRWYTADMANWILANLLVIIVAVVPYVVISFVVRLVFIGGTIGALGTSNYVNSMRTANVASSIAIVPVVALIQLLTVGLQRRAVLQVRGIQTDATEVFKLNGMGVQVFFFNLIIAFIALPGQLILAFSNDPSNARAIFEPGHLFLYLLVVLVTACIQILLYFTPLIIVDQRLTVGTALKRCLETFGPHYLALFGVLFCTGLIAILGIFACCIGLLFTIPIVYTVGGVIYNDFFRASVPEPIEGVFGAYPRPE